MQLSTLEIGAAQLPSVTKARRNRRSLALSGMVRYVEQHTKRQVYKNAKAHDVYHRCLYFIFYQTTMAQEQESLDKNFSVYCEHSLNLTRINVLHRGFVYFILGQTDPKTPREPSWKWNLMSAAQEKAVEGKNKTFYCLAAGR